MSVLHGEPARDLWRLAGQVFTIALVTAAGMAVYVSLQRCYRTLHEARSVDSERERFADVFAHAERAPMAVAERLAASPGVRTVYPRIVSGRTRRGCWRRSRGSWRSSARRSPRSRRWAGRTPRVGFISCSSSRS